MVPENSLDDPQVYGVNCSLFDKKECRTQQGAEGNELEYIYNEKIKYEWVFNST